MIILDCAGKYQQKEIYADFIYRDSADQRPDNRHHISLKNFLRSRIIANLFFRW